MIYSYLMSRVIRWQVVYLAPGFLPGDAGGMVPEIRHSIPSIGFPLKNLVTLQRDISPRSDRADNEARTSGSGIFIASAIS
jgi:hypothetical protein